jgi:hypothetical protein
MLTKAARYFDVHPSLASVQGLGARRAIALESARFVDPLAWRVRHTNGRSRRPLALKPDGSQRRVVTMSKSSPPQSAEKSQPPTVASDVRARLERAKELAERARAAHCGDRRRWSEEGALEAALVVLGVSDEFLTAVLENHIYAHRLWRSFKCTSRCRARDLWAVLWRAIMAAKPSRDWPIRRLLAGLIEVATGYVIKRPRTFGDQVARELKTLPKIVGLSPRRRTKAQKRLLATYNVTVDWSRDFAASAENPRTSPNFLS